MKTLMAFMLMYMLCHITFAMAKDKKVDFRNLEPVAFGMLITELPGEDKRVVYVSEREDLSLAKFLVVTSQTETFIYCYGTYTDLPKADHFVALQGESMEYVVELKEGLLTNCWLSKKHLF